MNSQNANTVNRPSATATARELFIVEGESAGLAVERVCNRSLQSVIAMQGKPLNAWKASQSKVESYPLFRDLIDRLGGGIAESFRLESVPWKRVIMLFDPDADGIHCCALMLWFFHRWMPSLLEQNFVFTAAVPMCQLHSESLGITRYPTTDQETQRIMHEWRSQGAEDIERRPFRGLASLGSELLFERCVDPKTRLLRPLGPADAIASLNVFQPKSLRPDA